MPALAQKSQDGRHARSARTRRAIVDALLELVEAGTLDPTAAQIARRARVAERSIRQHFPSRESLFLAAVNVFNARVAPAGPVDSRLPLGERVAAFVAVRIRELEACAPIRRAARFAQGGSSSIGRATDGAWQRRRREVAQTFAPELAARPDPKPLLDALDLLTHGQTWDTLRQVLRLSASDARALVHQQVLAALSPAESRAVGRRRVAPAL